MSIGSTAGGMQRAVVIASDGTDAGWRLYAWLPRYPTVGPSDRIGFDARVEPVPPVGPSTDGNSGLPDGFRDYLRRNLVVGTVRVRDIDVLPSTGLLAGLERLRRTGGDLLGSALPSPASGLASGILIGLRDRVDRDVAADFTTSGLSHVVAISGWNIAVVGGVISAGLRKRPRRQRALAVLAAICAYTLLAGATPSVVRAAVMAGVCLLARESGRKGGAATALGLAAWSMVLLEPSVASDVGYQLSVASTAGLLAWSRPWSEALTRRAPRWTPAWLTESLAVSLTAQAATLPLVLVHFGRLSLIAPLANLAIAPIVAPVMLASLLALGVGGLMAVGVPALLLAPVTLAASLLLGAMIAIASLAASLPFASVELPEPIGLLSAASTAVMLVIVGTRRGREALRRVRRRDPARIGSSQPMQRTSSEVAPTGTVPSSRRRLVAATCGAGVALMVVAGSLAGDRADGRLRMTVLDVGQGDAILLEGARGARVLVDGGPDPDRLAVVLDERIPAWDRRIDLVVLTHPHEDHVAGLALLLERYRVRTIAEPGMLGPGPGDRAFRAVLDRGEQRHVLLANGQHLSIDGADVTVLWPRGGEVPRRAADTGTGINNVSIVFDIRFGARRLLLTGDVEEDIDPRLLADDLAGDRPVDVLEGRPPWQRDGDHRSLPGCDLAAPCAGERRSRQPVRASSAVDHRTTRGARRARPPHRSGRKRGGLDGWPRPARLHDGRPACRR